MKLRTPIRHFRLFALLSIIGLGFPSYVAGQSTFHFVAAPSLDPGDTVYTVVMGDFNGDGKLDIATATSADYFGGGPNPQKVVVFLGNGNGTFQARRQYDYSSLTGAGATFQLAADFNGDGILDLALGNGMTTLLSNGVGN